MKNILLKIIVFVFSAAVGFWATDIIMKYIPFKSNLDVVENITIDDTDSISLEKSNDANTNIDVYDSVNIVNNAIESDTSEIISAPVELNLDFDIISKKLNPNKFDLTVKCKNLPEEVVVQNYNLYLKNDTVAPMMQASNGVFTNVDYKSADGTYLLCIVTSENRLSSFKEVGGFVKPVEVKKIEKMSKDELQELVSNIEASGEWYKNGKHPQIAKNVNIKVLDKINNREYTIKSFSKLRNEIGFISSGDKSNPAKGIVKELTYDSDNKINSVVVEILK